MEQKIENVELDYHRNGISGESFYVATFDHAPDGEETRRFVATLFPDDKGSFAYNRDANPRTAVLALDRLAEGDIAFGSNSWRGDNFDRALREEIARRG